MNKRSGVMLVCSLVAIMACKARRFNQDDASGKAPPGGQQSSGDACAAISSHLINPINGDCQVVADACQAAELKKQNWVERPTCQSDGSQCARFFRAQDMILAETGACAKAGNGCAAANLEAIGYRLANGEECMKAAQ